MTEKQGGSDVRANTTTARPLNGGGPGGEYEITGHKWFFSAPMCDAFLVLAQADGGLSCFLLPRFTPDGERNRIHLQRLKDKLGNRSNASSEVEFRGAWARLVGEEGRGVPTIIEMVNHTRLDCVAGGRPPGCAPGYRAGDPPRDPPRGVRQAARRPAADAKRARRPRRSSRRRRRSPRCGSRAPSTRRTPATRPRSSSGASPTPVLKYWICKRAPVHAVEALECLGGNGYVEESGMPRLYRESPLASIWEGSGNVQCLDVLRGDGAQPRVAWRRSSPRSTRRAAPSRGSTPRPPAPRRAADLEAIEARARGVVERMALVLQGSLLVRYGDPAVADAFCASRLAGDWGLAFGTLPAGRRLRPHHRAPQPRRLSASAACGERAVYEPALVQAADDRLGEADGVGEGAVVDVLRRVGGPVVVGRLLEAGAGAERGALVSGGQRDDAVGGVAQAQVGKQRDTQLVGEPVEQGQRARAGTRAS